LCLKTDERMKTVRGHASTSGGLLHCISVVHVASSWRSRGSEAKDGRFDGVGCGVVKVGPNYPSLDVIFLLPTVSF
jgi:hypothetical protein